METLAEGDEGGMTGYREATGVEKVQTAGRHRCFPQPVPEELAGSSNGCAEKSVTFLRMPLAHDIAASGDNYTASFGVYRPCLL